jgi:hypothetical protein
MEILVFRGLRKECRMGMYENGATENVWTIDEVTGLRGWRRLPNKEFYVKIINITVNHNMYFL